METVANIEWSVLTIDPVRFSFSRGIQVNILVGHDT